MKSFERVSLISLVGALGYFVDIFDLTLFANLRLNSLLDLNVPSAEILQIGALLVNSQMIGLLIGGLLFGFFGDRFGRKPALFGSILLYSLATLGNAFVTNIPLYGLLRFLSGLGLAGELGLAVTLLSETTLQQSRMRQISLIPTLGILGGCFGAYVSSWLSWRQCYGLGGVLGLLVFVFRWSIRESEIYFDQRASTLRQFFSSLFLSKDVRVKFLQFLAIGLPIQFMAGIIIPFAPELAKDLQIPGEISVQIALVTSFVGGALGNFLSPLIASLLKSQKKAIGVLMLSLGVVSTMLFCPPFRTVEAFYSACFLMGLAAGYFSILLMITTESFATAIRATASSAVVNFSRASVIPVVFAIQSLILAYSLHTIEVISGTLFFVIAIVGYRKLET